MQLNLLTSVAVDGVALVMMAVRGCVDCSELEKVTLEIL
jgi:hypothetical protein